MSELEQELERWRRYVYGTDTQGKSASPGSYKNDLTIVNIRPRFKHFRPPMWKIFMWAYKVEKVTYFTGVYPVGIRTGMEVHSSFHHPADFTFTAHPYHHETIDNIGRTLKEQLEYLTRHHDGTDVPKEKEEP